MTQINTVESAPARRFRNPLDIIILAVASRFGEKGKEVERFLKFAIVGICGAMVDFGTLLVLQATILPPRDVLSVAVATTISFCAAIINNFTWNRFWTYPDSRSRSIRRQLAQFAFVSVIGWLCRTAWISASYHAIGNLVMPIILPLIHNFRPEYTASEIAQAKLGTFIAMIVGVIVVMFWNFFVNRYWTYNDVD